MISNSPFVVPPPVRVLRLGRCISHDELGSDQGEPEPDLLRCGHFEQRTEAGEAGNEFLLPRCEDFYLDAAIGDGRPDA